jgi:PAS domain S-box-containing protein
VTRILIVEDDWQNLDLLKQTLGGRGRVVITASNGREALERALADPPDIVVSDILMPVMDGFELCRRWKADERLSGVPFVFYTATYTDRRDEQFARSLGAERYIVKPQRPEILVRVVEELLAERRKKTAAAPVRTRTARPETIRQYNEILSRKLEKKVADLKREIENRLRVEEEISFRNAILTAQLETTVDAVLAVDENGKILFTNKRFVEIWEIPYHIVDSKAEEITFNHIFGKLIDPEKRIDRERKLFEDREARGTEEIALSDGRIIERYSAPIKGADGRYFGRIWYLRDITETRKHAKQVALQAELLDSAIDSIFLLDADGNVVYANRNAAALRGYTPEEILRLNLRDLNDPESAKTVPGRLRLILSEGFALYESVHVKKDGRRFNVEVLARTLTIDGKKYILNSNRDVTSRKRSLEALTESEARYRALYGVSLDVIYAMSMDGTFAALNPAFETITGWKREEWIGRSFAELVHPDDLAEVSERFRQVLGGATDSSFEMRIRTKSGDYRVGEFSSAPYVHDGKIIGMHGIARDITERKRAETAIRESEGKFRSIFDNASEGIILIDEETMNFSMCNPACAAMTGYTQEEFTARGPGGDRPVVDLPEVKVCVDAFRRGKRKRMGNVRFRRKDRSEFFADVSVARAAIAGRKYFILIFTDVTARRQADREIQMYKAHLEELVEKRTEELRRANEHLSVEVDVRKKAEESLNKERTLLRTLIDSLPDQIYAKDGRGRFSLANVHVLSAFGLKKPGDLLGRTDFDFFPDELAERLFREEQKIIKAGAPLIEREEETLTTDGEKRWLLISKVPFRDDEGGIIGLVGINRDITKLKRTEENLQKAKEQAEAANDAKSAFLAAISHEIRTPMNAILGYTQLMLQEPYITPRQRQRLTTINKSGEHLIALLNNVLEMSKIETGHASVNEATFDLRALIGEVEAMFLPKAAEKRLRLTVSQAPALPGFIVSDEMKIRQILINLVGNAVKFTDEGTVTIRVRTEMDGEANLTLLADVEDTGKGIPEEDAARIFREFGQGKEGAAAGGAGLGLVLSRRLARLLGGDITLETRAGQGSLFRLRIPVREGAAGDGGKTVERKRVSGLKAGQRKFAVLIVDDDAENRRFLKELLSSAGFEAAEAENGKEAVARFNERRPDLVFMDVNMDVMDGYEATRKIREAAAGKPVPVVAVTANAFSEIRDKIMKSGFNGVVVKPLREHEIFDVLHDFLGVEYAYETPAPPLGIVSLEKMKNAIADLPGDLRARMLDAARNLEMKKLMAAIDAASKKSPETAEYLRSVAKRYQYRLIVKLLGEKGENDE